MLIIFPANHEKEDWINGERTEDVVAFLDRLYTAKRKVEQRIVVLGGEDDSVSQMLLYMDDIYVSQIRQATKNLPRDLDSHFVMCWEIQAPYLISWSLWIDASAQS
jgi:hypothetical protein